MKNERGGNVPNAERDPLEVLRVIPWLEVGPVHLEKRRLIAPYKVNQRGGVNSYDLIYRFEEEVFVPDEPASLNLASMLAVQVSLNYGLFCDEIILHGCFDRYDRQFIEAMARNTAREIYVKKFLEPNLFFRGPVTNLPLIKRESYLRARIIFEDEKTGAPGATRKARRKSWEWDVEPFRHTVLSSGGKESLLTYGLLREIGYEINPIFLNESGRHWFTALNAYRHFAEKIPGTARVWTNADRLFNWMLKHFPFVRRDFARIRSDEYPIRLWTVALLIFGALPILRKRRIGRLLIGDEFDTTRRRSHGGIIHYDGLYDQSRYFDDAMTRYFHRKGWGISQFSVLRPLSELLIEKILAERYPELQRHQVSCHATHKEGERFRPCGRCEKCRRVVGMLMAIGSDPANCGYTLEQIDNCLKDLAAKGVNQDTREAEHLAFLLNQKGLSGKPYVGAARARPRLEMMKLRFDPERSPIEGIPLDLREPLYRLCLRYSDGAVKSRVRAWIDFDLLADEAFKRPYPFETPRAVSSFTL